MNQQQEALFLVVFLLFCARRFARRRVGWGHHVAPDKGTLLEMSMVLNCYAQMPDSQPV
jgi:hypothetical protein